MENSNRTIVNTVSIEELHKQLCDTLICLEPELFIKGHEHHDEDLDYDYICCQGKTIKVVEGGFLVSDDMEDVEHEFNAEQVVEYFDGLEDSQFVPVNFERSKPYLIGFVEGLESMCDFINNEIFGLDNPELELDEDDDDEI